MTLMKVVISLLLSLVCLSSAATEDVVVLTKSNFDSVVDGSKTVFVEFYVSECEDCKKLEPIWTEFGKAFAEENDVVVAKVDATVETELRDKFEVKGYPTLKIFNKGETEATAYEDDMILERFVDQANSLAGTSRLPDGSIDAVFGTMNEIQTEMSAISCEGQSTTDCIKRLYGTVRRKVARLRKGPENGFNSFDGRFFKYYKTALMKLQKKENFCSTEIKRLENLLRSSKSLTVEVKLMAVARRNILLDLQKILKAKLNISPSDEL